MLLWTVINLVSNIEITFNRIWEVHVSQDYGLLFYVPIDADSNRSVRRTFSVYEYHSQTDG